ncbi:hypothetical protein [Facilibium subflavum]|uniref:hypothetical protein n=1 Tax=Facilibium subflavum TaxID=2219058 RepID=UPI0013C2E4D9|nr:hypothetical protein [Facilibium subflavum]
MGGVAFTAFGAFHLLDNVYELALTGIFGILFALLFFIYMQRALVKKGRPSVDLA